ncbi:trans-aconitate methyltransferase [Granulicella aggregans]|uniref:Trans-aconitate methyltransferase n=1 Tax=Granulicella aggregans TaxID=474949 RepID=A0A7W8E4Q5_9BACT|nr:class I SAM-dependent methyltransferase [Granulicella aggregans]MBB5058877.1 trans-aconitate methyltransferase [Granulicella aggregans]
MKDQATPSSTITGQTWDTAAYAANGRFVATLAKGVVELLAPRPGEHILDLGCGDGALTEELADAGAIVTGVDASAAMVEAARARGLRIDHHDATALPYESQFDAVFSNAALHWIRNAPAVLAGVHRALRPGGRFVVEMGGHGNIAAIRVALQAVMAGYGIDAEETAASLFASPAFYSRLLEAAGFRIESIDLIPRPTPLPSGMEVWLNTFRNGVLDRLAGADRAQAVARTLELLRPVLCDSDGNWIADYVRLRFRAIRD